MGYIEIVADEPTWGCKILKFCKQSYQDFQKHGEINLEKLSYNRFVIRSLKTANKHTHTHTASKQTNTQCKRSLGNSVKRNKYSTVKINRVQSTCRRCWLGAACGSIPSFQNHPKSVNLSGLLENALIHWLINVCHHDQF